MEWKKVPPAEPETIFEVIARLLSAPETQAAITGMMMVTLVLLSRWIADRPYRKYRPPHHRNIML